MSKISPIEKEIQFLYNKHNKSTKFPLEIEKVEFPLYIIKILEKTRKRTKLETKKLAIYRNKVLYELRLKSWHLEAIYEEQKEKKRKETQRKIAENKDLKYENDSTKIKHFGIWFDKDENNKLNRETYAIIDKKVHQKPSSVSLDMYSKNPEKRHRIYENEQCTIYSDDWCIRQQQKCLENFDLNMAFFSKLERDEFDEALSLLLGKNERFEQVCDINKYAEVEGVYILVLDHYKQIYIGQSRNIKKRILQHWRGKKEFDKLIFGNVETSVLSIDSFGCLDTTRIFALRAEAVWDLDYAEKDFVDSIDFRYLLNRTAGGIRGNDMFAQLEIAANRNKRDFQICMPKND